MTNTPTPLEDDLRQRLHDHAADVPATDAMRMRVLTALEDDSWSPRRVGRVKRLHRSRDTRPFFLLAGVAASVAIGFLAFVGISQRTETVDVIAADPTIPATTESAVRLDLERVQEAMVERSMEESAGDWALLSETERVLSTSFVSATGDSSGPILRVVTPPPGTTPADVVASLSSTLFDTVLVDDSSGSIGGLESRVVRLETQAGATRLGFRIAVGTYVETAGTDRVFIVHITTGQPELVVFWVEASADRIDDFEPVADRLVESLASE